MKTKIKTAKLKGRDKMVFRAIATSYGGPETEYYFHSAEWVKIRKLVSENASVTISSELMDDATYKLKFGEKPWL
jgi:hypothetical protein